jgi:hypothetical protein
MADQGDRIERQTLAPWRERWARLGPLRRDLTLALAIKIAALLLLWWAFFSHPALQPMSGAIPGVGAHLISLANPEPSPHANH